MSPAPVLPRRLEVRGKGCQPVEGTPNSPLRTSRGRCISPTRAAKPASAQCKDGEVAEWLKAHAWRACIRATVSRVRIPLPPPPKYMILQALCSRRSGFEIPRDLRGFAAMRSGTPSAETAFG